MATPPAADALKGEGNALFKAGDFRAAVGKYTAAINAAPQNHVLFSNRSAAYCQMGEFTAALADAKRCVELAPNYAKGHHRLYAALHGLRRFNDALGALQQCVAVAPENKTYAEELDKMKRVVQQATEHAQEHFATSDSTPSASTQQPIMKILWRLQSKYGKTPTFGPAPQFAIDYTASLAHPLYPEPYSKSQTMVTAHLQWRRGMQMARQTQCVGTPVTHAGDASKHTMQMKGVRGVFECVSNALLMDNNGLVLTAGDLEALEVSAQFESHTTGAIGTSRHDQAMPAAEVVAKYAERRASGVSWDAIRPALAITIRVTFVKGYLTAIQGHFGDGVQRMTRAIQILSLARDTIDPHEPLGVRGNTMQPSLERAMRCVMLDQLMTLAHEDARDHNVGRRYADNLAQGSNATQRRSWAAEVKKQAELVLASVQQHPWPGLRNPSFEGTCDARAFHFHHISSAFLALGWFYRKFSAQTLPKMHAAAFTGGMLRNLNPDAPTLYESDEDGGAPDVKTFYTNRRLAADFYRRAAENLALDDPVLPHALGSWCQCRAEAGLGTLREFRGIKALWDKCLPVNLAPNRERHGGYKMVGMVLDCLEEAGRTQELSPGFPMAHVYDVAPDEITMVSAEKAAEDSPWQALPMEDRPFPTMRTQNDNTGEIDGVTSLQPESREAGAESRRHAIARGEALRALPTEKHFLPPGQKEVSAANSRNVATLDEEEEAEALPNGVPAPAQTPPPPDFVDAITADVMADPVKLPAGSVVDRRTIEAHLSRCAVEGKPTTCPFTRQPLTIDDVEPLPALRGRIAAWREERRAEKAKAAVDRAVATGRATTWSDAAEMRSWMKTHRDNAAKANADVLGDALSAEEKREVYAGAFFGQQVPFVPLTWVPLLEEAAAELGCFFGNMGPTIVEGCFRVNIVSLPSQSELKTAGNAAVRAGRHATAIKFYKAALALEAGAVRVTGVTDEGVVTTKDLVNCARHLLLSNRSLCHTKLGDADAAVADARACTELAPSFAKGWRRLEAALRAKGDDKAADDVATEAAAKHMARLFSANGI